MSGPRFTVIQISDLHLDPDDQGQCARLARARRVVDNAGADLVVISGDVSADGFSNNGMFAKVRAELGRFDAPVHVIPGNHDVGDKPGEQNELKPGYLAQWNAAFDTDRFCVQRDGWTLVGINTQVLGSGVAAEVEQYDWFDRTIGDAEQRGDQIAVFMHAAPYLFDPDEVLDGPSQYWGFTPAARRELLMRLDRPGVKLIANGHLHWHAMFHRGGACHVWCPSTSFIVDDAIFPRGGAVVGFMRYRFGPDGVAVELVRLDLPVETILFCRHMVDLPGRDPVTMAELVIDFAAASSHDGRLLPGVVERLAQLAKRIRITVVTTEACNQARQQLADLPVEVQNIAAGSDRRAYVAKIGAGLVVAVSSASDDTLMLEAAAIGIAVADGQAAADELGAAADVVCRDIDEALDLVGDPQCLKVALCT